MKRCCRALIQLAPTTTLQPSPSELRREPQARSAQGQALAGRRGKDKQAAVGRGTTETHTGWWSVLSARPAATELTTSIENPTDDLLWDFNPAGIFVLKLYEQIGFQLKLGGVLVVYWKLQGAS